MPAKLGRCHLITSWGLGGEWSAKPKARGRLGDTGFGGSRDGFEHFCRVLSSLLRKCERLILIPFSHTSKRFLLGR